MSEKKKDEDSGTSTSVSKGESWYIFGIELWREKYVLSVESKQLSVVIGLSRPVVVPVDGPLALAQDSLAASVELLEAINY